MVVLKIDLTEAEMDLVYTPLDDFKHMLLLKAPETYDLSVYFRTEQAVKLWGYLDLYVGRAPNWQVGRFDRKRRSEEEVRKRWDWINSLRRVG